MAFPLHILVLIMLYPLSSNAQRQPPPPGYKPSSNFRSVSFNKGFSNLWSPQHQTLNGSTVTIWLDESTGSGFKSLSSYSSGYFSAAIKLHPGYTAGVISCFYLSNDQVQEKHDEIDIEFLGTTPGKPYTLQTNVWMNGTADDTPLIGREVQFNLWFDPTKAFHNYAILWNPKEIIFFVDDIPIRRYPKKSAATFPSRPMWAYGSIWDASSWATEGGKYKADYQYQPFIARYKNFKIAGCRDGAQATCKPVTGSSALTGRLSRQQNVAMAWAQRNYKVYDYCKDQSRDLTKTSECLS
ncbi:Xyloglucan endotransglucosylase/hydrolase [Heracleum sosnowskyi]|uniref:Xyloglucan endotransglucosylase/hydrolase n=1 Tax=Heracleum sosnowskyi TaxID=360622 RepID=A0AAD8MNB0_9APIA|nr:Xyloglucan endotransglucosylase/hydrolase [Heracleum sosnowskyi]